MLSNLKKGDCKRPSMRRNYHPAGLSINETTNSTYQSNLTITMKPIDSSSSSKSGQVKIVQKTDPSKVGHDSKSSCVNIDSNVLNRQESLGKSSKKPEKFESKNPFKNLKSDNFFKDLNRQLKRTN